MSDASAGCDLPASYRLDVERVITDRVLDDTPLAINTVVSDVCQTPVGWTIGNMADLYMPSSKRVEDWFAHAAICAAGSLVIAGFMQSGERGDMVGETLLQFHKMRIPNDLVDSLINRTRLNLRLAAQEGLAAHREFREVSEVVNDHYEKVGESEDVGHAAVCGAGLTMLHLDRSWRAARREVAGQIAATEAKLVDFDSFFLP